MKKDTSLGFRIPSDVKRALATEAQKQDRSVAWLVERVLREYLTKHGLLKKQGERT